MKIIVSHDVDHITAWEHSADLIIPKFILRNFIELFTGYVTSAEIFLRLNSLLSNKWQNINELMKFNKENKIPATFFVGVNKGRYLVYSPKVSELWINTIKDNGFAVGVHGIEYDSLGKVKLEYETFAKLSGLNKFGIRMHYLMNSHNTASYLDDSGYAFDSTVFKMKNPYSIGRLWEFPVHIMDGYILCKNKRWQNQNLSNALDSTKRIIDDAQNNKIEYFTILFHDRYFDDSFKTWKDWFIQTIDYLKSNNIQFIDYNGAIAELES